MDIKKALELDPNFQLARDNLKIIQKELDS